MHEVVVIGAGLSGFAAAVSLRKRGKQILVVAAPGGATSVTSGAWDLGHLPITPIGLGAFLESSRWRQTQTELMADAVGDLSPESFKQNIHIVSDALGEKSEIVLDFDRGLLLPTSAGEWKRTFGAEALNAKANVDKFPSARMVVFGCKGWRFRASYVGESLAKRAKTLKLPVNVVWTETDPIAEEKNIPTTRVAMRLASDSQFLARLGKQLQLLEADLKPDCFLLPPIFLNPIVFSQLQKFVTAPIAELLPTVEPIGGYRLTEAIRAAFRRNDINFVEGPTVSGRESGGLAAKATPNRLFDSSQKMIAEGRAFVLATGKFFGGGIGFGYHRFTEPIFDLPLFYKDRQPVTYRSELNWRDSKINEEQIWETVGLRVNRSWQPVSADKKPAYPNVYACGTVIGGIDYAWEGVGLAFAALSGVECGKAVS